QGAVLPAPRPADGDVEARVHRVPLLPGQPHAAARPAAAVRADVRDALLIRAGDGPEMVALYMRDQRLGQRLEPLVVRRDGASHHAELPAGSEDIVKAAALAGDAAGAQHGGAIERERLAAHADGERGGGAQRVRALGLRDATPAVLRVV